MSPLAGLILNLAAIPVVLFRRTRFGNGLFAVLILCLTLSDVAVLLLSVLGSLIMEVGQLLWGGAPGSCQVRQLRGAQPQAYDLSHLFIARSTTGCPPG